MYAETINGVRVVVVIEQVEHLQEMATCLKEHSKLKMDKDKENLDPNSSTR